MAAVEDPEKKFYGVEFHPEVNHTERGTEVLQNFVFAICGAKQNWNRAGFIAETVESIRKQTEGARAICGLSGGVDSTVAAVLVHRAMGDRLTNVFVDTGLLRRDEFRDTLEMLRERLGLNVIGVDASERFLGKLKGVSDPEQKRKIIGNEFIAVFAEEERKLAAASQGGLAGEIPRAGDALSGRDRIGIGEGPLGGDQIAPQRRRTPEGHAVWIDRAFARSLQGRSTPDREGTGPAERDIW